MVTRGLLWRTRRRPVQIGRLTSGTEGRNRTDTPVKEPDFESGASTSSATPASTGGGIIIPLESAFQRLFANKLAEALVSHKWVAFALGSKGGHWPVTGDEADIIAQRKQSLADGVDKVLLIPAREVRAAD